MCNLFSVCALLACAALVHAAPVTPGELHILKDGQKEVKAKVGDLVVARIPNPALPKMVTDVGVTVKGAAKFVAAVNANDYVQGKSIPGSTHIKVYVTVEKGKEGSFDYSWKDGTGKAHKHSVAIEVGK